MDAQHGLAQRGCFDRLEGLRKSAAGTSKKWGGQLWAGLHEAVVIGVSFGFRNGLVGLVAARFSGAVPGCDRAGASDDAVALCHKEADALLGEVVGHAVTALWIGASAMTVETLMRRVESTFGIVRLEAGREGSACYHNTRQALLLGSFVGGAFLQSHFDSAYADAAIVGGVAGANVVFVPILATLCGVDVAGKAVDPSRRFAASMLLAGMSAGFIGGTYETCASRLIHSERAQSIALAAGGPLIRFSLCWGMMRAALERCTNHTVEFEPASVSRPPLSLAGSARNSLSALLPDREAMLEPVPEREEVMSPVPAPSGGRTSVAHPRPLDSGLSRRVPPVLTPVPFPPLDLRGMTEPRTVDPRSSSGSGLARRTESKYS